MEAAHSEVSWNSRTGLDLALLLVLVAGGYGVALTTMPICGEESRWANGGSEMLARGDWIVPRQQGQVFVDRPPMASWLMAGGALLRGAMDPLAIRLPSVLAILATTLLIYAYGRTFLDSLGAFTSAAAFASFGQVLELGRLGENEAVFTLLLGGALLGWHALYARGRPAAAWALGGSLAGLALLQKGIQSPVYFAAATGMFLLLRRDWREIFSWRPLLGGVCFAAIWLSWQIPFYWATDWQTSAAMWTRTVAHRFSLSGLLEHWVTYPLETLVCLLPWSPILLGLAWPRFRRALGDRPTQVAFLLTAIAVTYPSVMLAAASRGRYFMPLYPCFALLVGWVVERATCGAADSPAWRAWRDYLGTISVIAVAAALAGCATAFIPWEKLDRLRAAPWAILVVLPAAAALLALVVRARAHREAAWGKGAVFALAAFVAIAHLATVHHGKSQHAVDVAAEVERLRSHVPETEELVSFGAIDHRFAFFYDPLLREIPWPEEMTDVPGEVTWFVFQRRPGDTPQRRIEGRVITFTTTSGTLPVEWEEVCAVRTTRFPTNGPVEEVVLGRIRRDEPTGLARRAPQHSKRH